jgi:spore coat protein A
VVNGAVQPFLTVEPRMYRLRLLNGSQSRFYHLELAGGPSFNQIGSEGGMFEEPVAMNSILLLPAERADVIVDFEGFDGQDLVLKNRALPAGVVSPATPNLPSLMQFRVRGPVTTPGPQTIPASLAGGSEPRLGDPIKTRFITLEEVLDSEGDPVQLQINGRVFHDPVDENPSAGTIEDWSFVNISADTHPIHMHLTQFQVMGRTPLNGVAYAEALAAARAEPQAGKLLANNTIDPTPYLLGPEVPPAVNERGWKDTVGAHPNQMTRIRQKFDLPRGAGGTQKYVYHCHILEHEDNDMMRPYEVK